MRDAIKLALDKIEEKHGDIDNFVADTLGCTPEELLGTKDKAGYFSAEQVDALAMAIDNVQAGKGFIIGDQIGVGKGRFVAAMLRYAERQGRVLLFATKSPGLYGDMVRDLRDIGEDNAHEGGIHVTNNNLRGDEAIPLSGNASDVLSSMAEKAIAVFKRGKRPVIAVVNINAALLDQVVESDRLQIGDRVDPPAASVLIACARPVSIPAHATTPAAQETLWRRDLIALADCADRHAITAAWIAGISGEFRPE